MELSSTVYGDSNGNQFIGYQSPKSRSASDLANNLRNVSYGYQALNSVSDGGGDDNIGIGYKAGFMKGHDRRNLLKFVMTSDSLPFVQGEAYMASWDSPLSEKRLLKLSYLLANLIKKGKGQEMTRDNWKKDLIFLFEEYYKNKHTFSWPKI